MMSRSVVAMKMDKVMVIPAIIALPIMVVNLFVQSDFLIEVVLYLLFGSIFLASIGYFMSIRDIKKLEKEIDDRMRMEEEME